MSEMKVYKTFGKAKVEAGNRPIIRLGKFYFVGCSAFTECSLIDQKTGVVCGHVSMKHLNRLGNANWAEAKEVVTDQANVSWPGEEL